MKIAEVYKKFYERDLLDEFNYPESVAGYNEALNIVISNSGLGIQDLLSLLNEKKKESLKDYPDGESSYKFKCGFDYVRQNLPTAHAIAVNNITNPVFIDFGTALSPCSK